MIQIVFHICHAKSISVNYHHYCEQAKQLSKHILVKNYAYSHTSFYHCVGEKLHTK